MNWRCGEFIFFIFFELFTKKNLNENHQKLNGEVNLTLVISDEAQFLRVSYFNNFSKGGQRKLSHLTQSTVILEIIYSNINIYIKINY